ncbi:MAG: hypothetical protein QGI77_13950, partial [Roseibacillus sp.]|nr:hypothetical protein [Roseibacillus sp.]
MSSFLPVLACGFLLLPSLQAGAASWSEWGGSPDKNMVSAEKGLPVVISGGEEFEDREGEINPAT